MNFTSLVFLAFFPAVLALYWLLPQRWRWALLLSASWLFYSYWNPPLFLLLLSTTLLTYAAGPGLAGSRRRVWLAVGVGAPLLALAVFKYTGFFLRTAAAGLRLLGWQGSAPVVQILLPVGISFYTFQTLSYVLDVYRGRIAPERHFGYYALFVSFFPQLVAGPIERPEHLLPQLRAPHRPRRSDFRCGVSLLLTGYFKKLVLADALARLADPVYAAPGTATGPAVVLATVCFAVQIYCDFSGYSDIALGTARLMGIRLTENFLRPYAAPTIRDFWRRWHISLNRWFTDYLYKPLGGSRAGLGRQVRNVMLVFLVSGLWHGADWTFVLWGGIHGLYLCLGLLWRRWRGEGAALPRRLGQVRTFALTCFAWLFFRADSVGDAVTLLGRLGTGWNRAGLGTLGAEPMQLLSLLLGLLCLALLEQPERERGTVLALRWFLLTLTVLFSWLLLLAAGGESAFLYFQF